MDVKIIEVPFHIERQRITCVEDNAIIAGSKNHYYAVFDIDAGWEDITDLEAVFIRDGVTYPVSLNDADTLPKCQIPAEVMSEPGHFHTGIRGGDCVLSDLALVKVERGCPPRVANTTEEEVK